MALLITFTQYAPETTKFGKMNLPTGQTRRRIFTHDGSNDADSRKDVRFWDFFFTLLPI